MTRVALAVVAVMGLALRAPAAEEASPSGAPSVRVAGWNVQFGSWCTPEEAGEFLKPYGFDVICFGEAPAGDWTARVGKVLGMEHSVVGKLTPYPKPDHAVKVKSILSRTPLKDVVEHDLKNGWAALQAHTTVRGIELSVYSLHIGGTAAEQCQEQLARDVLPKDKSENIIMAGDFNATVDKDRRKRKNLMGPLIQAGMRPIWTDLGAKLDTMFSYYVSHPTKGESPAKYTDAYNMQSYGVIDHMLIGPKSKLVAVKGGLIEMDKANPLSDHKPVWALLELKK